MKCKVMDAKGLAMGAEVESVRLARKVMWMFMGSTIGLMNEEIWSLKDLEVKK